jgi:hypothetical protein
LNTKKREKKIGGANKMNYIELKNLAIRTYMEQRKHRPGLNIRNDKDKYKELYLSSPDKKGMIYLKWEELEYDYDFSVKLKLF